MYLILKDVDNKASAGNKFENCNEVIEALKMYYIELIKVEQRRK